MWGAPLTIYHVKVRVLVAASDAYTREALVRATASDAVATGIEYLPTAVRSLQPDALVLDAGGETEATRVALERARAAAEAPLPALLLLSPNSLWLRGPLPAGLLPCVVIARTVERNAIAAALSRLSGQPVGGFDGGEVDWRRDSRELTGPRGRVQLTASESAIFEVVLDANGGVVPAERIATALWGGPTMVDTLSRAAIRSHVYTLRKKLRTAGLDHALVSLSGAGYRLHLDEVRRH